MEAERHYDGVGAGDEVVRRSGPAFALKRFHNLQKKLLIDAFVPRGAALLDIACGRGGDAWKWADAGVSEVVGVDVSSVELAEATRRTDKAGVRFEAIRLDAREPFDLSKSFDATTCFFALHYFWESETAAHVFMENVARHTRPGGVFVGIVPDGRCVRKVCNDAFEIRVHDLPACFGASYAMTVADTVTAGAGAVREHMVFSNVLEKVAAAHGLHPVDIPWLSRLPGRVLWHFDPPYDGDWRECTLVYAAFAFRKHQNGGGS